MNQQHRSQEQDALDLPFISICLLSSAEKDLNSFIISVFNFFLSFFFLITFKFWWICIKFIILIFLSVLFSSAEYPPMQTIPTLFPFSKLSAHTLSYNPFLLSLISNNQYSPFYGSESDYYRFLIQVESYYTFNCVSGLFVVV